MAEDTAKPHDTLMNYDAFIVESNAPAWRSPLPDELATLENEYAKVVVWPQAGGAITEYIQKKTGTNFVAGKVRPGAAAYGWKDVMRLQNQDPASEWLASLPHHFRYLETPSGPGIEVKCQLGDLEAHRLMILDRNSAKLTVTLKLKNVGKDARRVWPRWHPYMSVGDPFAESSGIFVPDAGGNIRQIRVGEGWDHSFLSPRGFAIVANWNTGEGLWMTYDPKKIPLVTTWTDYKIADKHPMRGAFTFEPWLVPTLKKPGEAAEVTYVYTPFTRETDPLYLPTDELQYQDVKAEAHRFAQLVKPHLAQLGKYTMIPSQGSVQAAIEENRFWYSHRRRDRMALRDWGFADALFSMPGVQNLKARVRFYGALFEDVKRQVPLRFVFYVEDASERKRIEVKEEILLSPTNREVDLRREIDLSKLDDGLYEVGVLIFEGDEKEPIHRVVESRKLVAQRRNEIVQSRKASMPSESSFVKALRTAPYEASSTAKLRIPIGIEDASGIERQNWPVHAGIPFARGMVRQDAPLNLLDSTGKEVVFDRNVSGTWDDGSIRWLQIDFGANVPANGYVFYHLESGKPHTTKEPLLLSQSGTSIHFDNGNTRWKWIDGEMLGPLAGSGMWWTAGDGTRSIFAMRGEGSGIEIEQNGVCRAVVRVTGWYYAPGREKPVARGILRFEVYRDQPHLRIFHNVMFAGDPWNETLGSFGLEIPLPNERPGPVGIALDGKTNEILPPFLLKQRQPDFCKVETTGTAFDAQRADGAFTFPNAVGARTVVIRDFWQMYPKGVEMRGEKHVTISYWPDWAKPVSMLPREDGWLPSSSSAEATSTGMSRTHELIILDGPIPNLMATQRAFDEPVIAIVPPKYLCETKTMLHLQPYDPDKFPEIESAISQSFDSYLLGRELWGWYGEWTYGCLPNLWMEHEYRWADFGRYGHILNELDIVQTPWLAYMRSGDRKYYKFAEANTRQLLEVSTINWSDVWPEDVGLSRRHHECVWLSSGDYGHSMLDPFLDMYRMTGYRPAWDGTIAMANAMSRLKHGEWRYLSNPLAGLARMYLETQDPKYRSDADRLWNDLCVPNRNEWWTTDHGTRAAMYYSEINPECKKLWGELALEKPGYFDGMDSTTALFLETKNQIYAKAALEAFQKDTARRKSADSDPLQWGLGGTTQEVLSNIRQMMYVAPALEAAKKP